MLNGLDLFSGIGGLTLALQDWVNPVAYCEKDRYCQGVLLSRMADRSLPYAPIWDDIKTFPGEGFRGGCDILYGGFPCQDISVAGLGKGLEGKRSGLFFEILRLAKEIKPTFIFLENVPAIRLRGLNTVGEELANAGYDCRWCVVSAAEVGAPHLRKRWFLLAHSPSKRLPRLLPSRQGAEVVSSNQEQPLRCCDISGQMGIRDIPESIRMADGIPHKRHRAKCLGNAVVPLQAKEAFKRLMGLKK